MAKQFVESVDEADNDTYYVFTSKSLPYDNDTVIPTVNTALQEVHYSLYDDMLFGKRITSNDVSHMIRNVTWATNQVYAQYDHRTEAMQDTNFFVVSQEGANYYVFKCMSNNGGANTSDQPLFSETSADDEYYQTNDGYQWKYMYTVSAANYAKFATADYVPVIVDANVTANSVVGSLESMIVNDGGTNYYAYATGTFEEVSVGGDTLQHNILPVDPNTPLSPNTNFYNGSTIYIRSGTGAGQARNVVAYSTPGNDFRVTLDAAWETLPDVGSTYEIAPQVQITGDGTSAIAITSVNTSSNSVLSIEIVNKGQNYTYADIVVVGNTGTLQSVPSADVSAIISPPGGHGSDVINELYSDKVCVSTSFANTESSTIPIQNEYRKFGLIKNPKYANVEVVLTTSDASNFIDGETIVNYTSSSSNTLIKSYTYTLGRYQTLTLDDDAGFANTETVSSTDTTGEIINVDASANTIDVLLNSSTATYAATDYICDDTILRDVTSISVADPALVITATAHTLANATPIIFANITTDLSLGTTYYPRVVNTTAFEVYTDVNLTASANNSVANTGGHVTNGNQVAQIDTAVYSYTGVSNTVSFSGKDDNLQRFGMTPQTGHDLPLELYVDYNVTTTSDIDHDGTSFDINGFTLDPSTDTVVANIYTTTETQPTLSYIGGTNGEVTSRIGNTIRLTDVDGVLSTGTIIRGLQSGATATISTLSEDFNTFNQLTRMAATVTATGTIGGIGGTGFAEDMYVTQAETQSSGYIHSIDDVVTRPISGITAADPAVVTTTSSHEFANSDPIYFKSLNGTDLDYDIAPTTYYVRTLTSDTFEVYEDATLLNTFDNSAGTTANTGYVTATKAYSTLDKTFYLNNVKGVFAISDDFLSITNEFTSNTSAVAKITSRIDPDLVDNSGEILFVENMLPINRATDQTEKIKIIFDF
tara:strand:+ start:1196 stop:4000 length:2805 start_codon:yes stop_codon:yes gene_type:complete